MQYEQSNDGFYKMHTKRNSSTRYIHTDDFKGADIRCRLGSMKIYFDQANIQEIMPIFIWILNYPV